MMQQMGGVSHLTKQKLGLLHNSLFCPLGHNSVFCYLAVQAFFYGQVILTLAASSSSIGYPITPH